MRILEHIHMIKISLFFYFGKYLQPLKESQDKFGLSKPLQKYSTDVTVGHLSSFWMPKSIISLFFFILMIIY